MRHTLLCLCLSTLAAAAAAQNAAGDLPAEAAKLRATFRAELVKLAESYNASLLPLAETYVLDLRRLSQRAKEAKDAAGAEAVRAEASRFMAALAAEPDPFETVPELAGDAFSAHEALRLIQEAYVARRTVNDLGRHDKARDLADKYVAALDRLHARLPPADPAAAAARKEANRVRVVLQRKDFANRLYEEAGARCLPVPPVPDVAALKDRLDAEPAPATRNLSALTLADLPPAAQAFLMRPLDYDKEWPPEIVKWTFEASGPYSHDFSLFRAPGLPEELGIFVYPKTLRAYVRGTKRRDTVNFDNKALTWLGQAMSWRLSSSDDLVCKLLYHTKKPALNENGGPAACVAVYSISEGNRLIASMSVPMLAETTQVRLAKHYSYNRLNIVWEGAKRKRGFTIPDHMPIRVAVGVASFAPGEEVDALVEILPCGPLGDMW